MTAPTIDRSHEQAVLDLAERGYHVFPVRAGGKTPLTTNGWKDASRGERQILQWWDRNPDANVGVACGTSGIVVFDIDSKSGANPTEILQGRDLHGAPLVLTGKAPAPSAEHPDSLEGVRGAHVYFRGSLKTGPVSIVGCEIRGDGAYVIAPPSVHESGVRYTGQLPATTRLPEIPAWLLEMAAVRHTNGNGRKLPAEGPIVAGGRNHALASKAGQLRRSGASEAELFAALKVANDERCQPPLPEAEVAQIAHSIARYPPAEAVQAARTAVLTTADAKQATRALEDLLGLGDAGIHIKAARVYGKGSGASVEIDLSNGETMTFAAIRDMLRPQTLIGELGVAAEITISLKQPACAEAMVLTKRLAQFVPTDGENDLAREWGRDFLELAETIDVDMTDQDQRWGAFEMLAARNRWGDKNADREGGSVEGPPIVLRHEDGTLYVRTVWFERYVRARDSSVSRIAVGARMARVGWGRRGKHGDIKATARGRNATRIYPFWIVPAGWLGELEARDDH